MVGSAVNAPLAMGFVRIAWSDGPTVRSRFTDRPVAPPIAFMCAFEPPERNGDWLFVTLIFSATILLSTVLSRLFGATADPWSILALTGGVVLAGCLGMIRVGDRVWDYRFAGIRPVIFADDTTEPRARSAPPLPAPAPHPISRPC